MEIAYDLIAAVSGPGWKYGLSRILIDSENNGVVYVAGSDEPLTEFTAESVSTSRGKGTSPEGAIEWRRRGSSCQYKLAKCKVSTAQMTERWAEHGQAARKAARKAAEKAQKAAEKAEAKKAEAKAAATKKTAQKDAEKASAETAEDLL